MAAGSSKSAILAIGTEVSTGRIVNTNASFLARELFALGLDPVLHLAVPDDDDAMAAALAGSARAAPLVLVSGGLGPTEDDRTRDALARHAGVSLVEDADSLSRIEEAFRRIGRAMPPSNRRQAQFPAGAAIIANPVGTAPAFHIEVRGTLYICLPGVPRELHHLWRTAVKEIVLRLRPPPAPLVAAEIWTFGWPESRADEAVARAIAGVAGVRHGTMVTDEGVAIVLRAPPGPALDEAIRAARAALGSVVYGTTSGAPCRTPGSAGESAETTLAEALLALLDRRGASLAVAESCTGGQVAARLTAVPGASRHFLGGVVAYANAAKTAFLDVPADLIERCGAVSAEVAAAMAGGVRRRLSADIGGAITGIAGPSGGTDAKPVGLVYLGIADAAGTRTRELRLPGDRHRVQVLSSLSLLDWLRLHLGAD